MSKMILYNNAQGADCVWRIPLVLFDSKISVTWYFRIHPSLCKRTIIGIESRSSRVYLKRACCIIVFPIVYEESLSLRLGVPSFFLLSASVLALGLKCKYTICTQAFTLVCNKADRFSPEVALLSFATTGTHLASFTASWTLHLDLAHRNRSLCGARRWAVMLWFGTCTPKACKSWLPLSHLLWSPGNASFFSTNLLLEVGPNDRRLSVTAKNNNNLDCLDGHTMRSTTQGALGWDECLLIGGVERTRTLSTAFER